MTLAAKNFTFSLSLLCIAIFGILMRFQAALGELWLDEIYSLRLVQPLASLWQVFNIFSDNNHYLNSLYLLALSPDSSALTYRLPALFFGVLTLGLAIFVCLRRGLLEGLVGAVVFSFSYILILYGSEARGYSSLLFFSLLSFVLVQKYNKHPSLSTALCFWLSSSLGLLSHFTFLQFYAAILLWGLIRCWTASKPSVKDLAVLHSWPLIFSSGLVLTRFSHVVVAGGPQGSRLEILLNALSLPYGGGELSISDVHGGVLSFALAVVIGCVLIAEILRKVRDGQEEAWFFFTLIVAIPVAVIFAFNPEVFVVRYVLLSIFFSYFVFVSFLARMLRRDRGGRVLAGLCIGLFVLGNANLLEKLMKYGRGQYMEALKFVAENSVQQEIFIGSDQDFRNSMVIDYYAKRAAPHKTFQYLANQYPHPTQATWVITHSQDQFEVPPESMPDGELALGAVFNSAPLSGLRWFVYCRKEQCPVVVNVH